MIWILLISSTVALSNNQYVECVTRRITAGDPAFANDLANFNSESPLINNGVPHVPIRNQQCAEICWSYAFNEFVDGLKGGAFVATSADHNSFWHFYYQFISHSQYFTKLVAKVKTGKMTQQQAIDEAVMMLHSRPGSAAAQAAGFEVDPGSDEATALGEVAKIGLVPDALFDHPITTPKETETLQATLGNFVKSVLSNPEQMSSWSQLDSKDGISDALYTTLNQKLAPFYKGTTGDDHPPYRPNDEFTYNGQNSTPLQFMSNVMGFDPTKYSMITMTPQNRALIYAAVKQSLTGPKQMPVMMGFGVYNQKAAEQAGVWSMSLFNGQKPVLAGGHEVLIVNGKVDAAGNYQGHIFQNSWGLQGLDINGKVPTDPSLSGFNGATVDYDQFLLQQGEGSDFVFSTDLLALPQFQSLKPTLNLRPVLPRRISGQQQQQNQSP